MEERIPAQETPENPVGACCGFRSRHHQPQRSACRFSSTSLGEAPEARGGLWRPRVDIFLNSHSLVSLLSGSAVWGAALTGSGPDVDGVSYPAFMKYQEVPFQVGSFTLKGFQSTVANLCHASLSKTSVPYPSRNASLLPFYITLHLCLNEDRCVDTKRLIFLIVLGVLASLHLSSLYSLIFFLFFSFSLSPHSF